MRKNKMAGVIKEFTDYPLRVVVFSNKMKNDMEDKEFLSYKVEKIIKGEDGYKNISNFNDNELARLSLLIQRAYFWAVAQKEKQKSLYTTIGLVTI